MLQLTTWITTATFFQRLCGGFVVSWEAVVSLAVIGNRMGAGIRMSER